MYRKEKIKKRRGESVCQIVWGTHYNRWEEDKSAVKQFLTILFPSFIHPKTKLTLINKFNVSFWSSDFWLPHEVQFGLDKVWLMLFLTVVMLRWRSVMLDCSCTKDELSAFILTLRSAVSAQTKKKHKRFHTTHFQTLISPFWYFLLLTLTAEYKKWSRRA